MRLGIQKAAFFFFKRGKQCEWEEKKKGKDVTVPRCVEGKIYYVTDLRER